MTSFRERAAWCLFDFANSAFNTIVVTFVYAVFFTEQIVGDAARGETLWARSLTIVGLCVAVLSPILGSIADRHRVRRGFLIGSSMLTIVCTALLFFPQPGGGETAIWTAFALVTVANIAFEIAFVFYNSFLPQLGDARTVGRLSGKGWALGYAGGLGCLVIVLVGFVGIGDAEPWFGVTRKAGAHVRASNLLVAAWFLVFALPMFCFVRERASAAVVPTAVGRGGLRAVLRTLAELREHPDLLRLFVARLFYNDGLMAIIGLAALYMSETLRMPLADVLVVAIWLNVAAGLGALGFGFVDDRFGGKRTIVMSLIALLAGIVLALAWPTVPAFWVAATLIGIGLGPNQSASRTLLARFIQPARSAEFFGLFAFSGKATVWLGPFLFAWVRPHFEDQRVAFLPIVVLLLIGFVLVLGVDEARGVARAQQAPGVQS